MLTTRAANLRVLHRGICSFGAILASRLRPAGVISKAQAMTRATGKPRTVSNTTSLTASRPGSRARRQPRKQLPPCRRDAALARRESWVCSFLSNPSNVFLCSHERRAGESACEQFHSSCFDFTAGGLILEPNSIVSGEFENIPNSNCRWLSWSQTNEGLPRSAAFRP
jgi:hypothetical protein